MFTFDSVATDTERGGEEKRKRTTATMLVRQLLLPTPFPFGVLDIKLMLAFRARMHHVWSNPTSIIFIMCGGPVEQCGLGGRACVSRMHRRRIYIREHTSGRETDAHTNTHTLPAATAQAVAAAAVLRSNIYSDIYALYLSAAFGQHYHSPELQQWIDLNSHDLKILYSKHTHRLAFA